MTQFWQFLWLHVFAVLGIAGCYVAARARSAKPPQVGYWAGLVVAGLSIVGMQVVIIAPYTP